VGSALAGRHCTTFIKDDIVDDKNTNTQELIENTIEWDASTIPIFDVPESGESEEIVIGTPWSNVDVYSIKRTDEDYAVYIRHALENDKGEPDYINGESIFPDRFSKERLYKIRQRIRNDDLFFCQYMCDPHGGGSSDFKRSDIHYWDIDKKLPDNLEISITIDPGGISDMNKSDYMGATVVGVDHTNTWYVIEATKIRLNPREHIEFMFDIYKRYPTTHTMGIETFAWQKALQFFAIEEMYKRNIMLPIFELPRDTTQSKESRIKGLIPRFRNGGILIKSTMKDLEDELFKRVINDDLKDALAWQLWIANRVPTPRITHIDDPFSIESILKELAQKHSGRSMYINPHLAETYMESLMVPNHLKEGNA
jgi:hypothetical protein